ncbi:MAG: tetratricopeptide repeat protein [Planctomycetota bacterium]|jgi:tetratricopeptide (TPR) repeat protein
MRRAILLAFLAACSSPPRSQYVPGGADLPEQTRKDYRRVLALERNGDREDALELVSLLCQRHSTRLAFHLRRVRLLRELEGPSAAEAAYRTPPTGVDPTRAEILTRLATVDRDELSDVMDVLDHAVAKEPDEALWHLALADVKLSEFDATVARADREKAAGRPVRSKDEVEKARGQMAVAKGHAERALDLDKNLAEAHLMRGYLATREADLAEAFEGRETLRREAREYYSAALDLDPEMLAALLDRAENAQYFDDFTQALKDLETAKRIAPREPDVWNNLGMINYETGRLSDAADCYRRVLELRPDAARARAALADCLRLQGSLKEARQELEKARGGAAKDDALLAEIDFKLGAIYEYEQRYREAVEAYERHIRHLEKAGMPDSRGDKARSRIRHIRRHAFE